MGRRKTYLREEKLMHAMNAFWEKGYYATSLADLVSATGLNKNTLYTEFGSKEELFLAALRLYTDLGVHQAQSFLGKKPYGIENIRDYFRSMTYEKDCRGCLMTMTINHKNLVTPKSMAIVRRAMERIERMLFDNLLAAQVAGYIQNREECERLATFFFVFDSGHYYNGQIRRKSKQIRHGRGLGSFGIGGFNDLKLSSANLVSLPMESAPILTLTT